MRACSAGSSLGRLTCRAVKRTNEAGKYSPGGSRWRRTTSNAIVVVGHELPPIASRGTNKQTDQQSGWLRAGDNEASEAPICPHDRRRRPPCHLPAYSPQPAKGDRAGAALAAAGKQLDTAVHIPYPRHDRRQRLPPFCPAHCSGSIIGSGWERRISKLRLCVG